MKTAARWINDLEEGVISLILVAMTLLVFCEVIMRFVFNSGISWAQEVALHLSAWLVLFGASHGVKTGAHIGVDAFVRLMGRPARRVVAAIAAVLSMVYCALFLYGGWVYLGKIRAIGLEMEDLPFPKWIAHSILFIGFIMLLIRFLQLFLRVIGDEADGFDHTDEAEDAMRLVEDDEETRKQ